jgi:prepilin-type processing-associated H-X9-DG protein
MSAVRGNNTIFSSGVNGSCAAIAIYKPGLVQDNCAFNAVWATHPQGANFCFGDGSVRTIAYGVGNQAVGVITLLEALATRNGDESIPVDY